MTVSELYAIWRRYAHRNSTALTDDDLAQIHTWAQSRVTEALLCDPPDDMATNAPLMVMHAGLIYIHQWAQDDEGILRETAMFQQACENYTLRKSLDEITPQMQPWYMTASPDVDEDTGEFEQWSD